MAKKKNELTVELTNLRRMMRFAEKFTDFQIVATLSASEERTYE